MESQDDVIWAQIPGDPQYWVSNYGQVLSKKTDTYLAHTVNREGHAKVNFMRDGTLVTRSVGPLVARAFLEKPVRRDFNAVIHLNGDKTNCAVHNLAWRTRHFAVRYHQQFDSRLFRNATHPVMDLDTQLIYATTQLAAMTFGLLVSDILVSSYARTFVWPTFQRFQLLDD